MITKLAIIDNQGTHPKHRILDYHSFFAAHILPADNVVDIGCGDGVLLKKLHSLGYRNIAGIDFSSSAVEKLQALNIFPVHHIDLDSPNPFVSLNKKYEYGLLVCK
jgi:2-polyprenyl-3-methyl-5-hydroxy-6-metoxy-1,4-benzoquinol methylase